MFKIKLNTKSIEIDMSDLLDQSVNEYDLLKASSNHNVVNQRDYNTVEIVYILKAIIFKIISNYLIFIR